eukprot:m.79714 g.79714  ORF g.79714 m.79714 type:complete len:359 (+) comp12577_c1_seq1:246-1322(+)
MMLFTRMKTSKQLFSRHTMHQERQSETTSMFKYTFLSTTHALSIMAVTVFCPAKPIRSTALDLLYVTGRMTYTNVCLLVSSRLRIHQLVQRPTNCTGAPRSAKRPGSRGSASGDSRPPSRTGSDAGSTSSKSRHVSSSSGSKKAKKNTTVAKPIKPIAAKAKGKTATATAGEKGKSKPKASTKTKAKSTKAKPKPSSTPSSKAKQSLPTTKSVKEPIGETPLSSQPPQPSPPATPIPTKTLDTTAEGTASAPPKMGHVSLSSKRPSGPQSSSPLERDAPPTKRAPANQAPTTNAKQETSHDVLQGTKPVDAYVQQPEQTPQSQPQPPSALSTTLQRELNDSQPSESNPGPSANQAAAS